MLLEEAQFSNYPVSNSNEKSLKSLSPGACKEFEKNFSSPCSFNTDALKENKAPGSMGVTQILMLINKDNSQADELVEENRQLSESLFQCNKEVEEEQYFSVDSHDSFENIDVDLLQEQACKTVTILSDVTIKKKNSILENKDEDVELESGDDIFTAEIDVIENTPQKKKPRDNM